MDLRNKIAHIKKTSPIVLVVIVALVIRLVGLDHGFPYIYHPDEPTIIRSALGIRFDPNPHHFDWPHLYIYLNYFVYMIFAKFRDIITAVGLKSQLTQIAPLMYNDNLIFYLLSRTLSAVLGALTAIPLYLWTKKLTDKKTALFSATLLALTPLHVRNSHYALVDVPMLFFLCWALYFSTRSAVLSGLFLGFSASTKYNGILGGLFIGASLFLNKSKNLTQKFVNLIKLGIFIMLGFVIGTPFAVLDFKTFTRTDGPQGALWQFTNVGKVGLTDQLGQFFDALLVKLPENLGYTAFIVFAIGTIILLYNLVKKQHRQINRDVLLATLVFYILTFYVSGLEKNRSHYYLITYPFFLLTAGWTLNFLTDTIKRPVLKIILAISVLTPSLIMSIQNIKDLQTKTSSTIYGGEVNRNQVENAKENELN